MKGLILACLVIVAVSGLEELGTIFQSFKLKYDKTYKNHAEETKRFNIFSDNLRSIEEHNARFDQGLETYTKGVNQFADMTLEEFKALLTVSSAKRPQFTNGTKYVKNEVNIPDFVDWRSQGQVTGVKNQGACGSCWAFSVIASTEAAYFRKTGNLVSFSEQQLVDCATDVNYGCDGGYTDMTFQYIQQYGVQTESSYPYTAVDGNCQYNSGAVVTRVDGSVHFNPGDEDALLNGVGSLGPVSVCLDATFMGQYASGIYNDDNCSPEQYYNHAVLIVGYGTENGIPYWLVKNSWGEGFGEQGYFRIIRGQNKCGIATDMVYPYIN
jgi:C1A family cysteine protease